MKKILTIKIISFYTIGFLALSLMRNDIQHITIYDVFMPLFISGIGSYLMILWFIKKHKEHRDLSNILMFLQILRHQNKIRKVNDIISIVRTNSPNLDGEYRITVQDGDNTLTHTYPKNATWFSLKEFWIFCAFVGSVIIYILFPEMNQYIPKVLYITPALVLLFLFEEVLFIEKIQKKYLPKDLHEKGISIINIIRNDHADIITTYRGERSQKNEYFICSWNNSSSLNDGPSKQIIHR